MKEELSERARRFFMGMENSFKLSELIKMHDQLIQFDPKNEKPFYVQIAQGKVNFGHGKNYPPNIEEGLYITGEQESLESLFKGEMSLAEAIYHHKIQIPGYREKEPLMVIFSKLLQRGIEVYGLDHL